MSNESNMHPCCHCHPVSNHIHPNTNHGNSGCDVTEKFLAVADEAWKELLKEKIKKEIALSSGNHLDELAKLVAATSHTKWTKKMGDKKQFQEYRDNLYQLLDSCNQDINK